MPAGRLAQTTSDVGVTFLGECKRTLQDVLRNEPLTVRTLWLKRPCRSMRSGPARPPGPVAVRTWYTSQCILQPHPHPASPHRLRFQQACGTHARAPTNNNIVLGLRVELSGAGRGRRGGGGGGHILSTWSCSRTAGSPTPSAPRCISSRLRSRGPCTWPPPRGPAFRLQVTNPISVILILVFFLAGSQNVIIA